MALINELIDSPDGLEIANLAVATILAEEIANQVLLAEADSQDVSLYQAKVYENRMDPWDTNGLDGSDQTPIINVWTPNTRYEEKGGTVRARRGDSTINIDLITFGVSKETAEGHNPGDLLALNALNRFTGYIRRILMSGQYTYLGSPRKENQWCFGRWVTGTTTYQPDIQVRQGISVVANRIALGVHYIVDSPQVLGETFELLSARVKRESDGQLLVAVDVEY